MDKAITQLAREEPYRTDFLNGGRFYIGSTGIISSQQQSGTCCVYGPLRFTFSPAFGHALVLSVSKDCRVLSKVSSKPVQIQMEEVAEDLIRSKWNVSIEQVVPNGEIYFEVPLLRFEYEDGEKKDLILEMSYCLIGEDPGIHPVRINYSTYLTKGETGGGA